MAAPPTAAELNFMLVDAMLCVGRGVGSKKVSIEAAQFWSDMYATSIATAIVNGAVWKNDRDGVLLMATKLGRKAKLLAGLRKTISEANAKKASEIISRDPTCTAGGGRFCPP
ncbi:MAG TPA: hypothetical protein VES67_03090 [Vicinamibacterales bacterium]|nr:hypothetical protein [Vicinamibacterales bacterium]